MPSPTELAQNAYLILRSTPRHTASCESDLTKKLIFYEINHVLDRYSIYADPAPHLAPRPLARILSPGGPRRHTPPPKNSKSRKVVNWFNPGSLRSIAVKKGSKPVQTRLVSVSRSNRCPRKTGSAWLRFEKSSPDAPTRERGHH